MKNRERKKPIALKLNTPFRKRVRNCSSEKTAQAASEGVRSDSKQPIRAWAQAHEETREPHVCRWLNQMSLRGAATQHRKVPALCPDTGNFLQHQGRTENWMSATWDSQPSGRQG